MFDGKIALEGLPGVERLELDLEVGNRAYVFIGTNGVGKTQCLEALFQLWFFANEQVRASTPDNKLLDIARKTIRLSRFELGELAADINNWRSSLDRINIKVIVSVIPPAIQHQRPVIFLGANSCALIQQPSASDEKMHGFEIRRVNYFKQIIKAMDANFSSLNMQTDLQSWITTRAKEPLNRSVLLRRSRSGEILRRHRDSFCPLSLTLSYFFVALLPFLRPFLHNRRNTAY